MAETLIKDEVTISVASGYLVLRRSLRTMKLGNTHAAGEDVAAEGGREGRGGGGGGVVGRVTGAYCPHAALLVDNQELCSPPPPPPPLSHSDPAMHHDRKAQPPGSHASSRLACMDCFIGIAYQDGNIVICSASGMLLLETI